MEYLLGALVLLLALGAVIYPLVRPEASGHGSEPPVPEAESLPEITREMLYREIAELQFDLRLGKLDQADYVELRERLLGQAAELLAEEDRRRLRIGDLIERQVAEIRGGEQRRHPSASSGRSAVPSSAADEP